MVKIRLNQQSIISLKRFFKIYEIRAIEQCFILTPEEIMINLYKNEMNEKVIKMKDRIDMVI